jgi:hypothetical protein
MYDWQTKLAIRWFAEVAGCILDKIQSKSAITSFPLSSEHCPKVPLHMISK